MTVLNHTTDSSVLMLSHQTTPDWLTLGLLSLKTNGFFVLSDVFDSDFLAECQARMRTVQQKILSQLGPERLSSAGERGVLRLMMAFDPFFLRFLENTAILSIVNATLGSTALLHLQNGFVYPSSDRIKDDASFFQATLHRDFPRYLNGYLASINTLAVISDYTISTGCLRVVPNSHQQPEPLQTVVLPIECPAGSLIVFDSTLLHAAGQNTSGQNRFSINHQFTRSFFKQQLDTVRALSSAYGEAFLPSLPEQTQQLLGYFSRVPTSLEEYYQPEAKRLYRKGQG